MNRVNIACVLKSGGDYTPQYVVHLLRGVREYAGTHGYTFHCLTDNPGSVIGAVEMSGLGGITCHSPIHWSGWWSKLNLFRVFRNEPTIFFDLDTYLCGDLSTLITMTRDHLTPSDFLMLLPFRSGAPWDWASGIMAWNGDFSYLEDEFRPGLAKQYRGHDQVWIAKKLEERGVRIRPINNFLCIVSYKHHCRDRPDKDPPELAEVVCFHGHPRPHEVGGMYWR